MKFPFRPITKPQIKKIHTLKNLIGLSDDNYEALLHAHGVESSTELNRDGAAKLIENLLRLKNGQPLISQDKLPTGLAIKRAVFFDRTYKATDNQIGYMMSLWKSIDDEGTYQELLWFIKKVTGELYIHIESLEVKEASNVIYVLEKWNKQKELR